MNRAQTIDRIGHLEAEHCKGCERWVREANGTINPIKVCGGCDVFNEIRALGDRLNEMTAEKKRGRFVPKTLSKGAEMTDEEVKQLIKEGVFKKDIAKALGISGTTLRNRYIKPKKLPAGVLKNLSVEDYYQKRFVEKRTRVDIAAEFNVTVSGMRRYEERHMGELTGMREAK